MPIIEGVGDEVVQVVGAIVILAVAVLAWWSTNARGYRTVFVMRSSRPPPPGVRVTLHSQYTSNQLVARSVSNGNSTDDDVPELPRDIIGGSYTPGNLSSSNEEAETSAGGEPAMSNEQMREMNRIVEAMERETEENWENFNRATFEEEGRLNGTLVADDEDSSHNSEQNNEEEYTVPVQSVPVNSSSDSKINIKLKYLNDTCKLVDGNLNELLKDFKWRHFSRELTAALRVRLIFNGHVLEDSSTLLQCGLHDQAVVHCLVHPGNRGQMQQAQQRAYTPEVVPDPEVVNEAPQERAWDLENVLMTLVSVALTVVWFFRCEYSNMFTASASVALFGLTVFYSVAIFGLYLSENHRRVQN